jgi:hypothetical protein
LPRNSSGCAACLTFIIVENHYRQRLTY